MNDSIYISYLENKHYKKIRKSDEPVVFTARKGAVWAILVTLLLGALADFKASMRQLFLVKRHVEIKWSEIEKLCRPGSTGSGLYFYTKSGQRHFHLDKARTGD